MNHSPLQKAVPRIHFAPLLKPRHRSELNRLFFLNASQKGMQAAILAAVDRYGLPRLKRRRDFLRITLDGCTDAQNLFAIEQYSLRSRLVGCVVYLRESLGMLAIVHLAVHPEFTMAAIPGRLPLAAELISQVKQIAKSIKGVQRVALPYAAGRTLPV